ncbi:MAG: hypothetical protein RMJ59_00375 [Candidatus Nitrosocaldus sp.]|nr:hypothetical protein [Candidatus Nitrosocaldus sp.]MCS7140893.1 hypothetical protein [Candidatus Nitrosocaldus sp.]MDW7999821.1 hypothetical protein [Candidatus Nitrosocaldus sp.]MDW8274818.1 hypothetical protein [Candidatus Nitrosocaldus sp.]
MREEEEWWHSKWLFPLFVGAVFAIALFAMIPNLPWVKNEVRESSTVVSVNGSSCTVETDSHRLINVADCMNHEVGDRVNVKYRETTSVGELTGGSLTP